MTAIEGRAASQAGNGCCLAIGQEIDDTPSLQIADDRAIMMTALERPVIDADHAWDLHRQHRMTPDDAQQGVLADRQEQASREALPWPSAQGQAEVMHNTLQPRRAAGERTRGRGREPLREDPLMATHQGTTEPPRADADPYRPALCRQIRQHAPISTVDPRRSGPARRTHRRCRCRAGQDKQSLCFGLDPLDNKPARCKRQIAAHQGHPSPECPHAQPELHQD
jgi:hypothetical protein